MRFFKRMLRQFFQPRSEPPESTGPHARLKSLRTEIGALWGIAGPTDETLCLINQYNRMTAQVENLRRHAVPGLITTSGIVKLATPCVFEEMERGNDDKG